LIILCFKFNWLFVMCPVTEVPVCWQGRNTLKPHNPRQPQPVELIAGKERPHRHGDAGVMPG